MDSSAPPSFLCPIGCEIMRDPVTCADGHSYECANIERWLATHITSPKTGAQLPNKALTPNHALRNAIEEWLSSNFKLVPRSAVTFDEDAFAHGSFKSVHRGTLQGRSEPIAVSRMRMGGSCEEEAKKLVKLGRHPDLVRYLGLCTEGPEQLLLTELAPHGSLDQFLEAHEDEVTLPHKLKMLEQICAGMVAISGAGMIHRDLATRNILVFVFDASDPAATRVKITDFGLSMDRLYQTHAYGAQGEAVPFRWMSPEALQRRRFSEKSDVWAFGVTAWELLTGGQIPFAFIASNEAVAERVCGGERLTRPGECPDDLWALLLRMWAERPADRPTFAEVADALVVLRISVPPVPPTLQPALDHEDNESDGLRGWRPSALADNESDDKDKDASDEALTGEYTWTIESYSKIKQLKLYSPVFQSGQYNWCASARAVTWRIRRGATRPGRWGAGRTGGDGCHTRLRC